MAVVWQRRLFYAPDKSNFMIRKILKLLPLQSTTISKKHTYIHLYLLLQFITMVIFHVHFCAGHTSYIEPKIHLFSSSAPENIGLICCRSEILSIFQFVDVGKIINKLFGFRRGKDSNKVVGRRTELGQPNAALFY